MSSNPVLRATSESGDVVDDPSEDALFEMLGDLEAGDGAFLIVELLADTSGQTYVQTLRNGDGTYVVEHRAGGPDRHVGTEVPDVRSAHALVAGWATGRPGWDDAATWRTVST